MANPKLYDQFGGGIVFYVDKSGTGGLIVGEQEIATMADWPTANKACQDCDWDGYTDWRLPTGGIKNTPSEMHLLYENMYKKGHGKFAPNWDYWSSTPGYGPGVWRAQTFDEGGNAKLWRDGVKCNVRPVREYSLELPRTENPVKPGGRKLLGATSVPSRPEEHNFVESSESELFSLNWTHDVQISDHSVRYIGEELDDIYRQYQHLYARNPIDPDAPMATLVYLWDFGMADIVGFANPNGSLDLNTQIFDHPSPNEEPQIKNGLQHELFHLLQYTYGISKSEVDAWFWEGSAMWAEMKYLSRVSAPRFAAAWFNAPNKELVKLRQERGLVPNCYSAAPMFAYLDDKASNVSNPVDEVFKQVAIGSKYSAKPEKKFGDAVQGMGWTGWNHFYVDFLSSRFTDFWSSGFYSEIKMLDGNPLIYPNAISAIRTKVAVNDDTSWHKKFNVRRGKIKCFLVSFDSDDEMDISLHVAIDETFDGHDHTPDSRTYWAWGMVDHQGKIADMNLVYGSLDDPIRIPAVDPTVPSNVIVVPETHRKMVLMLVGNRGVSKYEVNASIIGYE